jgi:hypothetical protein
VLALIVTSLFVCVDWGDEEAGGGREGEVLGAFGGVGVGDSACPCGAPHHCCADGVVSLGQGSGERRHSHLQVSTFSNFCMISYTSINFIIFQVHTNRK